MPFKAFISLIVIKVNLHLVYIPELKLPAFGGYSKKNLVNKSKAKLKSGIQSMLRVFTKKPTREKKKNL